MTAAPKIDVRDLQSVRAAARSRSPALVLGEDWVEPDVVSDRLDETDTRRR